MSADDLNEIAARVSDRLIAQGATLSVCESSAGGLISATLLAIPGASRFFIGGLVVYTGTAREALLGITPADLAGFRPATERYAELLAGRCREKLGTSWSVAETGATGPTGNRYGDPAGHACLAVGGPRPGARTVRTGASARPDNMRAFARAALLLLDDSLQAAGGAP
jgi:PncC family amidohydrolase